MRKTIEEFTFGERVYDADCFNCDCHCTECCAAHSANKLWRKFYALIYNKVKHLSRKLIYDLSLKYSTIG